MNGPSIRRSLLFRTGTGVGLLLCLLSVTTYLLVRHGLYKELDASIEQTAALLANQVELEDGQIIFEWQEGIGTNPLATNEGMFQYWNEATGETTRSPALGRRDLPKFHGLHGVPELRDITMPGARRHARAIGMVVYPFVLPEEQARMETENQVLDPKSMPHVLVVARDAKPVHHILSRLRWILGAGTIGTLVMETLLIRRSIGFSLRPIDDFARHVRECSAERIDSALNVPGRMPRELRGLAEDFDALLSRVAAIRQRERDFIRHAAHELRTPIAGLQATSEVALSRPRDAESYIESLRKCHRTASELSALVSRLTALARIGRRIDSPTPEEVDLARLAADCLRPYRETVQGNHIRHEGTGTGAPPLAMADPALLRIIVQNLIDNAVCHGSHPGRLRIDIRHRNDMIELTVANPVDTFPKDPERFFEPLFRSDESRGDSGSHLGIGLTLSREAAEAIGGNLRVGKTTDGWIEFTLELPSPPR